VISPDINTQEGKDKLFAALRIGSIKYLDKCLQMGLNPLVESEAKSNLIHFAAESNSVELITTLISLGVPKRKQTFTVGRRFILPPIAGIKRLLNCSFKKDWI
jgi:hypothetical protein